MFLHDIVGDLTAEEARKSFKHAIKENDDDLFAPSDRIEQLRRTRKDPWAAYEYARDMLKARWPAAEPVIMRKPRPAYMYALKVIKGRWPEAEPRIMRDPEYAYEYARYVIRGRWPEAEPAIMQEPAYACYYAKDVIKARWPEAEPGIMQDPGWAKVYAKDVIGGRWPEAEPVIKKNPWAAYVYAKDVIGGRWPEAEPVIKKSRKYWKDYKQDLNISGKLKENDDDLFADSSRLLDERLIMLVTMWAKANREDQLELEERINDEYGFAISRLEGPYATAGGRYDIELFDDGTGAVMYFTDRNGIVEPSQNPAGDLNENDDDLFADRTVINPMLLARGIVQVADDFDYRADRVSTWAAAESYRDDASILRFAARACRSGIRACMKELMTIDDPVTWDYLEQTLAQDFDIDLSDLYDQYENGDLIESVVESDDDLFSDQRALVSPKVIATGVDNAVESWLDRAHDPVNYRLIELGYEGVEAVKEFNKGMGPGLRAWYQLDDELRDDIAASIKDDLDIDLYALYDSFPPINEEYDDDLFADHPDVSHIVNAIDEVADHWGKLGPSVKEDDPDWYHYANMLYDAAVEFKLHGVMQGMRALARIDVWEALADSLEFLGFDEVWAEIEQYIDILNEAVNDDEPELSADEREANLKKFLEPSHPDVQQRLYRGQRRAPKPNQFVLQKGRDTPSFTDDPEVANVYSRQLDIGRPEHGPGSTSVPVYLQMSRPLDIRGLGEYFSLLDFVAVLPRVDLAQESVPNGLGWYDLSYMVADLDELIYRTGAKSEIEASGSDSLSTIRDFEELAQEIAVSGEEGDLGQIEYMLSETQLDSFIIADSTDIVNRLEKMGYDGVILSDIFTAGAPYYQGDVDKLQTGTWDDEDRVITAYRPFDQGKIKSAIGNRGTYNTADPDIIRESQSTKYSK